MAKSSRLRRKAIRAVSQMFPGAAGAAMPVFLRWGNARSQALTGFRGIARGTALLWPYSGRAWTVGLDLVRPGAGQVLVSILFSAISPGTERAFFARMPNAVTRFPYSPGYSSAGEVVEVGKGVTRFKPGDRVALSTEHASVAVAPEREVVLVPPSVSLEEASFVHLGVIGLQALQKVQLQPGEPVVVLGHGLIGQLMVQMAVAMGASPVISVARSARRLSEPLQRAAQRVIVTDRDGPDAVKRVKAAVTFEVTGAPEAIPLAVECTRDGGRVVLAGSTRGATERMDFGAMADRVITFVGAHVTSLAPAAWPETAAFFISMLEQRKLSIAPMITERVNPLEAEWFYRRMTRPEDATLGAIFCWDRLQPAERLRKIWWFTPPDLSPLRNGRLTKIPISQPARSAEGA